MRLALLTGGSRGIGCALAQKLVIDGFRVIDFSRTAPHSYSVATDFASPLSAHRTVSNVLASVDSNDLEDLVVVAMPLRSSRLVLSLTRRPTRSSKI